MCELICPKCGKHKLLSISQEIDKLGLLCDCPHCGHFPWYPVISDYPTEPIVSTSETAQDIIQDIVKTHPDVSRHPIMSIKKTGITYEAW